MRVDGQTYQQIADHIGRTKQNVATLIKRHAPHLRKIQSDPLRPCEVPWCKLHEAVNARDGLCSYHRQVQRKHGDPCYRHPCRTAPTPEERLEGLHRRIRETEDGHWIWLGGLFGKAPRLARPWATAADYGGGTLETSPARVLYRAVTGTKLGRHYVRRQCDEPLCVAPSHHTHGVKRGKRVKKPAGSQRNNEK